MTKKQKSIKKRNPQDTTHRNVNALKKRMTIIEKRLSRQFEELRFIHDILKNSPILFGAKK